MKTKDVILGTFALTCAIGSAFATAESSLFVTAYAKPVGSGSCVATNQDCTDTGTANCKIRVRLSNGTFKDTNGLSAPAACAFLKEINAIAKTAIPVTPIDDVPDYVPAP